ncbi:MAG: hypothetical protein RTU92_02600 [Candidatus Thorarchaeota archaeon]
MKKSSLNVGEIVAEYLKKNGFDGLVEEDGECGCELDDLFPCQNEGALFCQAGYKVDCDCGENCEFHISIIKPENS